MYCEYQIFNTIFFHLTRTTRISQNSRYEYAIIYETSVNIKHIFCVNERDDNLLIIKILKANIYWRDQIFQDTLLFND